ncbi:50S ribosomal protein L4 [bioreactor metagenome]|jgi:large subunit ribosomal protein L4|uniref:50S ribosomal protein L4 n=1 Tax=bioreactor metagenome TaxID=1076179 RepID=A0A645C3E2_9ZZZZ
MQLAIIDLTGKNEKVRVSDALFVEESNPALLAQAVRAYLSNLRQGTSSTKTRSEVNRTKKKWFKQKGTGNARHGARTPNIFVGGGVSHGPRGNANWTKSLTDKEKLLSLKNALTMQKDQLFLSKDVSSLNGKTKEAAQLLAQVAKDGEKVLVVLAKAAEMPYRSLNNLENVLMVTASRVNALHVAMADKIIVEYTALKVLEDRLVALKKK